MTDDSAARSRTPARPGSSWWPWAMLATVVVVLLVYGTVAQRPPTRSERARALARTIRCPTCAGQSVATSDAPASIAVRDLIRQRMAGGESDAEIRDFVVARYPGTLLDPPGRGFSVLVWALPVAMVVVALAALALRFRDWRPGDRAPTAADRELVESARAGPPGERS